MSSLRRLGIVVFGAAVLAAYACGSSDGDGPPPDVTPSEGGPGDGSSDALPDGFVPPIPSEFGLDTRPANPTCKAPARPPSTTSIKFEKVFDTAGLVLPMMMAQIPGDNTRWFVAQRGTANNGTADIVSFGVADPAGTKKVVASIGPLGGLQSEGGLLGLAIHPKFATNGDLYVSWTRINAAGASQPVTSEIGRLHSTDNGNTFGGYTTILSFTNSTAFNHKGGGISFGKDGFLYVSFGDGGGGDDQFIHGQSKTGFFSKVLRLDVDNPAGGKPYGIPASNPFAGSDPAVAAPEVFAYGFRNPFRFSIDRESNELWVGDVGQNQWEEVDAKVKAGANYGWPCKEATHDYLIANDTKCPIKIGFTDPDIELQHLPNPNTRSITGGVVYRGKAIPDFVGKYLFGDYVKAEAYVMSFDPGTGAASYVQITDAPAGKWVSFNQDNDGEIYGLSLNDGVVYKVVSAGPPAPSTFPDRLSKTGCVDATDPKKPAAGLVPYTVNAALWSDGAQKDRWVALPDGTTITIGPDGDFDFPKNTVLMKTFALGGKRIETRLFVRHDDGEWAGYTYEWLDDQSDAVWLPSSKSKTVGTQTWTYPSRSDCVNCHSAAAGRSLGLELGQLNGDFVYPSTNRISNQLKTLDHIGMFAAPLGKPVDQLAKYPDPYGSAAVDARARAYLHANCSNCHRPTGPGRGNMDLRFAQAFKDTKTCNVDAESGDLGVAGAKLVVPGDPTKSIVSIRPHSPAANRMPPLASSIVDDKGVKVIDDWIKSLTGCP